jgi:putative transposase
MLNQTLRVLPRASRNFPKTGQLQLDLRISRRGGVRKGAGRKAAAGREGFVKHVARPAHHVETPVHVVVRAVRGVPYLRSQRMFAALRMMIARASEKGLRVLHFSVQANHLHLIVEADEREALARGVQRLLSRIALALNGIAQRRGKVWRDRYFRQDLTSPQQVRNALVYVLFNVRKHAQSSDEEVERWRASVDPYSSTAWLDGWSEDARPPATELASFGPPIVDAPRSWLLRDGWKRRGRIRLSERPRSI